MNDYIDNLTVTLMSRRDIVSPRPGKQHDSKAPLSLKDGSAFTDALDEVCEVVAMTEGGEWPTEFLAKGNPSGLGGEPPELLKKELRLISRNPERLALSVSMDKPWDLAVILLDELLARGAKFREDAQHVQFCDKTNSYTATMMDVMQSVHAALNHIFDIKYFWRKPRPEDYKATPGKQFTVDDLGAPGHWSYGAGHAAAAAAVCQALHRALSLDDEQSAWVKDACWQFANGRTLLGVHFWEDNAEGFRVGLQH